MKGRIRIFSFRIVLVSIEIGAIACPPVMIVSVCA